MNLRVKQIVVAAFRSIFLWSGTLLHAQLHLQWPFLYFNPNALATHSTILRIIEWANEMARKTEWIKQTTTTTKCFDLDTLNIESSHLGDCCFHFYIILLACFDCVLCMLFVLLSIFNFVFLFFDFQYVCDVVTHCDLQFWAFVSLFRFDVIIAFILLFVLFVAFAFFSTQRLILICGFNNN